MKDYSLPERKDLSDREREDDPQRDPEGFDPDNLTDEMDIDEDRKVVKINVRSKLTNTVKVWWMLELSTPRRAYYLNKLRNNMERDGVTVKDFKGLQESLLKEVLYEDEEGSTPVDPKEIDALATTPSDRMYMRAIYMNGLDKGANFRAKKCLSKT